MKKEATLINNINTAFPGANAVSMKEWDQRDTPGIWFRGSESCTIDGIPLYDCYNDSGDEIHPKLQAMLKKAGWFAEPYDSGTLMAYPA